MENEMQTKFPRNYAQGEVTGRLVARVPAGLAAVEPEGGRYIIGHSESGHHHVVMDRPGVRVFAPETQNGARVLYAIVKDPLGVGLVQDAPGRPHAPLRLGPGVHELRIAREFDPFSEEIRLVAD